jgi:hypothetical protein
MKHRIAGVTCLVLAVVAIGARPAAAQYGAKPDSNRATGETYHVEISSGFWNPTPSIVVSSEQLGIIGSQIDGVEDLGFEKTRFTGFSVVLRPATKHKLRVQYTPIKYSAETVFQRDIVFNGIRYRVGLPVSSELKWDTWRFGYEWDFVYRDRGFAGLLLDVRYTSAEVRLESLVANVSATFEMSFLKAPTIEDSSATYIDWDLYGTVNFNDHVGAQVGYRAFDVTYTIDQDFGDMVLKGIYFNGVVRF